MERSLAAVRVKAAVAAAATALQPAYREAADPADRQPRYRAAKGPADPQQQCRAAQVPTGAASGGAIVVRSAFEEKAPAAMCDADAKSVTLT